MGSPYFSQGSSDYVRFKSRFAPSDCNAEGEKIHSFPSPDYVATSLTKSRKRKTMEAEGMKSAYLFSTSVVDQNIKRMETEKAAMESVLARIREHQLPVLHTIIKARNAHGRNLSSIHAEQALKNAEMRSNIEAVIELLSEFHTCFLHPEHEKEFENYPVPEKRAFELAAKANFMRTSYDMLPKNNKSIKRARSI